MDLMAAIGLLSSIVTLEEAGRSWVLIVKDKLKRKEIDINNWDSDDPLVQACLDRFKTDMGDKYKDHIFSEEEIQEMCYCQIDIGMWQSIITIECTEKMEELHEST